MPPRYSSWVSTLASMMGSSICLMSLGSGNLRGVIDLDDLAGIGGDAVADAGGGGDEIDIELALQALLHDFQVQQAEEAAAEAEAEGHGVLGFEIEGAIVEAELFEGVAQEAVLVGFDGVEPGEHHGLDFLESGQGFGGGVLVIRDGVADLGVADGLDVGVEVADFAGLELVAGRGFRRLVAEPFHFEDLPVGPSGGSSGRGVCGRRGRASG